MSNELKTTESYLYCFGICTNGRQYIKIGVSNCSVESRLKGLQTGNPFKIIKLFSVKFKSLDSNSIYKLEQAVHKKNKSYQVRGEWFYFRDDTLEIDYIQRVLIHDVLTLSCLHFLPKEIIDSLVFSYKLNREFTRDELMALLDLKGRRGKKKRWNKNK